MLDEFDQNQDFIPLLPDSETEEDDTTVFEFDSKTMAMLISLSRGIPIDSIDNETHNDPYATFVHNISSDMVREDTINAPAPDYIHEEEYDENGNKVIFISDSEDDDDDLEDEQELRVAQHEQENPPEIVTPIVISDDDSDIEEPVLKKPKLDLEEPLPKSPKADVIELSSDEEVDDDVLPSNSKTWTLKKGIRTATLVSNKIMKRPPIVIRRVFRPKKLPKPVVTKPASKPVVPKPLFTPFFPSSAPGECSQCKIKEVSTNRLSTLRCSKSRPTLCEGCTRLFSCVATESEKADMIKWFATGKWPEYDTPQALSTAEILYRLDIRAKSISARAQRFLGAHVKNRVAVTELMKLYYASEAKCSISGLPVYFHNYHKRRLPYWSVSFDHIVPVTVARHDLTTHSVENLQVMCCCLNKVKGHYSDNELKDWFSCFMDSIKIEID